MVGRTVAVKDSWRDEDRASEGAIQKTIFEDIRAKLGDQKAAEAEKYCVKIRICEDIIIESGKPDATFKLSENEDVRLEWVILGTLSHSRHLPSTGHMPESDEGPTEFTRSEVQPPTRAGVDIPYRVYTRTVFGDVGTALMDVNCLEDAITCLSDSLRALYYTHKAGWVHRDFSVANVICVEKDRKCIGKLGDFEYAQKVDLTASHDTRTGTMRFMAVEVEGQTYMFEPSKVPRGPPSPFRMNFLHDLESNWWAAIWFLLVHTDADSPTQNLNTQWDCFQRAFPGVIDQGSRQRFLTKGALRITALESLSTTYREKSVAIFDLASDLHESYIKAEATYPNLSLDDGLLNEIHEKMSKAYSDALHELKDSKIRLRLLGRARRVTISV